MENEKNLILSRIFKQLFISFLITVIAMYVGSVFIPYNTAIIISYIPIAMLLIASINRKRDKGYSLGFTYTFYVCIGIGLYPPIYTYASILGLNTVLLALIITLAIFFGLSFYVRTSQKDFSYLGGSLFIGLIIVLIVSIIGIFVEWSVLHIGITILGILIFIGYILYDISIIVNKNIKENEINSIVINIYLDIINLFLNILKLIGILKSE